MGADVLRVVSVVGTRPEAIKMAPIIRALGADPLIAHTTVATGQHGDLLDSMLDLFGITPDIHLRLMRPNQAVSDIAGECIRKLTPMLRAANPALTLVQGDTATASFGALASFMAGVEVGHVEAGLRAPTRWRPFPEEMFRRVVDTVAGLHFAPTERCKRNLIREGVAEAAIVVTGNPVVDALQMMESARLTADLPWLRDHEGRIALLTMHRRESFGAAMRNALLGVRDALDAHPDVELIFPVHPNPAVRSAVAETLGGTNRVRVLEPLSYPALLAVLSRSVVVLTDSGGIQEEAPSYGVPVIVLRDETERLEGLESGLATCVGTDRAAIEAAIRHTLNSRPSRLTTAVNPYGDGRAAERTCAAIHAWAERTPPREGIRP